jgi:hypothetical protein
MAKKNKTPQKNNNVKVGKKGNAIGPGIQVTNRNKPKKGNQKKAPVKIINPAFNPSATLEGKDLKRSIQEQIKASIAPVLKNLGQQTTQLGREENTALSGEAARGQSLTAGVGNYYEKLAAEEAARIAAQQSSNNVSVAQVQAAANAAAQGVSGGNASILAGAETANPQGGASKEALLKTMAEQQGNIGAQGQALVGATASQGQNWSGLLNALAGSAQMRGGEEVGQIGSETSSNLNRIGNEFGKQRAELGNAKKEIIEKRPSLFNELLEKAIERERNYGLSRATLGLEKEKVGNEVKTAGEGVKYAEVSAKEQLKTKLSEIKAEEGKRARELSEIGASEAEKLKATQSFREKEIAAQNEFQSNKNAFREKELENPAVTGKGGKGNKPYEGYQTLPKSVSYLRGLLNEEPVHLVQGTGKKSAKQVRKAAYDKLVNFGASPQVAKAAIKKLVQQHKTAEKNKVKKVAKGVGF